MKYRVRCRVNSELALQKLIPMDNRQYNVVGEYIEAEDRKEAIAKAIQIITDKVKNKQGEAESNGKTVSVVKNGVVIEKYDRFIAEDLKDRQKVEALDRIKMLKMHKDVANLFKKGRLYYSERLNRAFPAVLYWFEESNSVDGNVVQLAKDFEEEYGAVVYHGLRCHMSEGPDMWAFLYVSKNEECWEQEREELLNGEPYAYVSWFENEIGCIGIRPAMGGVEKIW